MSEERDGKLVDSKCRDITSSWIRDKAKEEGSTATEVCEFFEVCIYTLVEIIILKLVI